MRNSNVFSQTLSGKRSGITQRCCRLPVLPSEDIWTALHLLWNSKVLVKCSSSISTYIKERSNSCSTQVPAYALPMEALRVGKWNSSIAGFGRNISFANAAAPYMLQDEMTLCIADGGERHSWHDLSERLGSRARLPKVESQFLSHGSHTSETKKALSFSLF